MRTEKRGRPRPVRVDRTNWHDLERRSFFFPPGTFGTRQLDLSLLANPDGTEAGRYGIHKYGNCLYGVGGLGIYGTSMYGSARYGS